MMQKNVSVPLEWCKGSVCLNPTTPQTPGSANLFAGRSSFKRSRVEYFVDHRTNFGGFGSKFLHPTTEFLPSFQMYLPTGGKILGLRLKCIYTCSEKTCTLSFVLLNEKKPREKKDSLRLDFQRALAMCKCF